MTGRPATIRWTRRLNAQSTRFLENEEQLFCFLWCGERTKLRFRSEKAMLVHDSFRPKWWIQIYAMDFIYIFLIQKLAWVRRTTLQKFSKLFYSTYPKQSVLPYTKSKLIRKFRHPILPTYESYSIHDSNTKTLSYSIYSIRRVYW